MVSDITTTWCTRKLWKTSMKLKKFNNLSTLRMPRIAVLFHWLWVCRFLHSAGQRRQHQMGQRNRLPRRCDRELAGNLPMTNSHEPLWSNRTSCESKVEPNMKLIYWATQRIHQLLYKHFEQYFNYDLLVTNINNNNYKSRCNWPIYVIGVCICFLPVG